jgi:hypothetical protein
MNVGTTILFFNADVGHDHREVIVNGLRGSRVFDTRIFGYDDDDEDKCRQLFVEIELHSTNLWLARVLLLLFLILSV